MYWVYPPGLVDRVVAACGCAEQRKRLLPARLVVYFVLGPHAPTRGPDRRLRAALLDSGSALGTGVEKLLKQLEQLPPRRQLYRPHPGRASDVASQCHSPRS